MKNLIGLIYFLSIGFVQFLVILFIISLFVPECVANFLAWVIVILAIIGGVVGIIKLLFEW